MDYKKYNEVELEMMVDEYKRMKPYQILLLEEDAVVLKSRYDSLVKAGFDAEQALEVIKARGSNI